MLFDCFSLSLSNNYQERYVLPLGGGVRGARVAGVGGGDLSCLFASTLSLFCICSGLCLSLYKCPVCLCLPRPPSLSLYSSRLGSL